VPARTWLATTPCIVAAVSDTSPSPFQNFLDGNPWRLGLLSLLAIVIVAGGVLLFGGADAAPEDTTTTSIAVGASTEITIPPLPDSARRDEAAPDFSLELFDGSRFTLSSHLESDGRPLILNFWASWCPPCRAEMPDFDAAAIANPGVLILGVAVDDDPIAAEAFATEIAITYPAGFDETGMVSRGYPIAGLPATFVISADGIVLRTVLGRLTVEKIDELIDIALTG